MGRAKNRASGRGRCCYSDRLGSTTALPGTGAVGRVSRVLVVGAGGRGVTTRAVELQGPLSLQDGGLVQVGAHGAAAGLFWGGDG